MRKEDNLQKFNNRSLIRLPIEQIKKRLITKKVGGKEYFYIREKLPDLKKEKKPNVKDYYVCSIECNDDELRYKFCLASTKFLFEVFSIITKLAKEKFSYNYLNDTEVELLGFLNFAYEFLLKKYSASDLERYEEENYTKYVYGTTSIEGNTYTLRETDLTLNEGITVGNKEKREFYEIENYSLLKDHLKTIKTNVDLDFIKMIHSFVLRNIEPDSAGHFRNVDVGIRGTEYEPPPAIVVKEELKDLIKWHKKNEEKIHPVELSAIFHQKFEEIHPFKDGNGRVGREILRLMLKKSGYPTIFIDKTSREEYLKSLDAGNKKEYKQISKFISKNILDVHKGLLAEAKKEFTKITKLQNPSELCKDCIVKGDCPLQAHKPNK